MSREQYNELPIDGAKSASTKVLAALTQKLQQVMREVRHEEKTAREALRELDRSGDDLRRQTPGRGSPRALGECTGGCQTTSTWSSQT